MGRAILATLGVVSLAVGCSHSPAAPSQPAGVSAPAQTLAPATGQVIGYYTQPVTLTAQNVIRPFGSPQPQYLFEIADNASFAPVLLIKSAAEGGEGVTRLALPTLSPNTTYYWRVHADVTGAAGALSPASTFSIGPDKYIGAPTPLLPKDDDVAELNPLFVYVGGEHPGYPLPLAFRFEVSTDTSFASFTFARTLESTSGGGNVRFSLTLATATRYYWRIQASDPSTGTASPYSQTRSFVTTASRIGPPSPRSPLSNATVDLRPTLVVGIASRLSGGSGLPAVGGVSYAFQVATDPDFVRVVAEGQVPETFPRVSFTPTDDLTPGVVYYWRAQATDVDTGQPTVFSPVTRFLTGAAAPAPATLVVRPSIACPAEFPREVSLDGSFVMLDGQPYFTLLPLSGSRVDLLEVTSVTGAGGQVAGRVRLSARDRFTWPLSLIRGPFDLQAADFTAMMNTAGNLEGTAPGYLSVWGLPLNYDSNPTTYPCTETTAFELRLGSGSSAALRAWIRR